MESNIINSESEQIEKVHKDLGVRMKEYESNSLNVIKIEPYRPFIVRLDGRCFSKFTKGLRKPFDLNFTKAMILTTMDLITEFSAATGYTHSDEITIIFKEAISKEESNKIDKNIVHIFDGRVIKLLTVMSGYCSVRFNFHFLKLVNSESNINLYSSDKMVKFNKMQASFDSRLVLFPEELQLEIINHMIWRSLYDCERNAVSTYARNYFNQKELQGKQKGEMISMIKDKGIDWSIDVPTVLKHGVYLKKENYEKIINEEKVLRTRISCKTFKIKSNDFFAKLLLDKQWDINEDNMKDYEINNLDVENL